ncbi:MAG TPA: hypothetical protein DEQ47_16635 [Solibacterales bacterium]|nr:hypothetical protein [Bryobacterales bacterium]
MPSFLSLFRKFLFAVICLALPTAAQTGLGIVTGVVQDASQSAIPKAAVELTNTATGAVKRVTANGAGIFYFGSLPVGPYRLAVEAPGFNRWERAFQVEAGQTVTLDAQVSVGNVESKVEVSAAATEIATEGSQLSDVKTAKVIHDLPLNGRQISNLFTLTPGVEGGQNTQGGGNPRTNGMMVGATEILLDGMSYVDRFGGGISRVQPGLDTIQEYRIETAGSGAAFDRPATIELVTRSGTNQFHGGLFETLRDNYGGLVARAVQDGNTPAKLIRNEFGGFVGGPIIKNKAFFFFDQELLRQRSQVFAQTAVPTDAMWNGDFSNAVDTSGNKIVIYNPFSTDANGNRTPFPGNIIPQNLLNQQVLKGFRGVSPAPQGPNAGANPWIGLNFQTHYPQTTDSNSITGRFDEIFSSKDNLSVRYTQSKYNYLQAGGQYGYPPLGISNATGTSSKTANVYNITTHFTHAFTPAFLNDLQLAVHRSANGQGTGADAVNWDSKLGLPNPFGATGWPTVYTDAYNMFYYGGWDSDNHKAQNLTQYEIDDNVTLVKGRHTLRFGFKGRLERNNVVELQQAQGSHYFDSAWTGLYDPSAQQITPFTGSGLASLELGLPAYLSNQYNRGFFYFKQKEIGIFADDSWKVTPKLTVSLGLRWEFWTPYREKYNRMVNLDLKSLGPTSMQVVLPDNTTLNGIPGLPKEVIGSWAARGLTAVSANSIGFPSALTPNVWSDIAPHLALAYRFSDKWVVRGGYGTYYWPMPLSQVLQSMRVNPPLNLRYDNSVNDAQGSNGVYALTVVPTKADTLGSSGAATVSAGGVSSSAQSFLALDVNKWSDNRMQEWTFTIERTLMRNMVLKLSYTGNHGSNLQQNWDVNAPTSKYNYQAQTGTVAPVFPYDRQLDPNWRLTGANGILRHNGYSNSNSLQAAIERRFSGGLSFQVFYAYTHAMTTNDSGGFSFGGSGGINASSTGGGSQGGGTSGAVPANNEILGNPNLSDSQRLRLLYTNSSQVPPQRLTWNGVYELPFGKGKKYMSTSGRALDALVGGWQLGFIGTWEGGFWMGVNSGDYLFGNPTLSSDQRLNLKIFGQNQKLWFAGDFDPTQASNVNAAALQKIVPINRGSRALHPLGPKFDNRLPQTLANGSVVQTPTTDNVSWNARNFMLGPPGWNQDASVFKYFTFTERIKLRMSGDFFNVFNHPLLNNPDARTGLINLSSQPNNPRIIQVGARLEF